MVKYLFIHYSLILEVRNKIREYIFNLYKYRDYKSKNHDLVRERNRKIREWCVGFGNQKYDTKTVKKGQTVYAKLVQWTWYDATDYTLRGELICGWILWMEMKYPEIKIMYDSEELIGICNDAKFYNKAANDYLTKLVDARQEMIRKARTTREVNLNDEEYWNDYAVMTQVNNHVNKYKDKKYI